MNQANGNGVMGILLVFGPCHGKHIIWPSGPLPDPLIAIADAEPPRFFQEYREGEPFGAKRPSMIMDRHQYTQKDIYDNGLEECAIYFHSDNCCEEDYAKSEPFRDYAKQQEHRHELPLPSMSPSNQEFMDMAAKIQQRTEEALPLPHKVSQIYLDAVQKMAELIDKEKEDNDRTD